MLIDNYVMLIHHKYNNSVSQENFYSIERIQKKKKIGVTDFFAQLLL